MDRFSLSHVSSDEEIVISEVVSAFLNREKFYLIYN